MAEPKKRPLGITLLIILFAINIIGDVQTLFKIKEIASIWSYFYLSWLPYVILPFFIILSIYLIYACIKRKKSGFRWAKVYFIALIVYAVLAFAILFATQQLTNELLARYAAQESVSPEAIPQEVINSTILLVNKLTFIFIFAAIALDIYILYYLSRKKDYFSKD